MVRSDRPPNSAVLARKSIDAMERMYLEGGWSLSEIGNFFHLSKSTVHGYLAHLISDPEVRLKHEARRQQFHPASNADGGQRDPNGQQSGLNAEPLHPNAAQFPCSDTTPSQPTNRDYGDSYSPQIPRINSEVVGAPLPRVIEENNGNGSSVADDKGVYGYVPRIVKYYLGEDIIIPNVPTYICSEPQDLKYVLEHLDQLVVKAANESGGYGMMIGPHVTKEVHAQFAKYIQANPRNYIAQPTLSLSCVPTIVDDHFEGRHVDLRPYILYGKEIFVLPGGLTRVALKKGSLVVNSSQGGGSKDTWVLSDDAGMEVDKAETESATAVQGAQA